MNRRRIAASFLGICLLAGMFSVARATITDELDPYGSHALVGLVNPDSRGYTGQVHVKADLGGYIEVVSVPFTIGAGESTTVTVEFKAEIVEIISASISERPFLN